MGRDVKLLRDMKALLATTVGRLETLGQLTNSSVERTGQVLTLVQSVKASMAQTVAGHPEGAGTSAAEAERIATESSPAAQISATKTWFLPLKVRPFALHALVAFTFCISATSCMWSYWGLAPAGLPSDVQLRCFLQLSSLLSTCVRLCPRQAVFLRAYRHETLYGRDMKTVYRNRKAVRNLVIDVTMKHMKVNRAAAKEKLNTPTAFMSTTKSSRMKLCTPAEKLRAAVPHF